MASNRLSFRRTTAAALAGLVLAGGAAVAEAQPAFTIQLGGPAASPAVLPRTPVIERATVQPMGRVQPGAEVRFQVVGLPAARVTLDIPGVARDVALRETRPGFYETTYVVRRQDNPDAFFRAVATMQSGPQRVTAAMQLRSELPGYAGNRWGRDDRAPVISSVTPEQSERVGDAHRTHISARFSDDRSGIDPASVRLRIDGRDVTSFARVSDDEVRVREDLSPGRHQAEVTLRDRAGNVARKSWSFEVVDRDRWERRRG